MATNLTRLRLRARGSGAKQQIKAGKQGEPVPVGGVLHALGGWEERIRLPPAEALRHGAGSGPAPPPARTPDGEEGKREARREGAREEGGLECVRCVALVLVFGGGEFVWLVPLLAVPWRLLSSWLVPFSGGAFPFWVGGSRTGCVLQVIYYLAKWLCAPG